VVPRPRSTEPIGGEFRAGGRVLPLLADAVNVAIVRALRPGDLRGHELTDRLQHVSRTTQFERFKDLEETKVIARETLSVVPRQSVYCLTEAGEHLVPAVAPLEAWLAQAEPEPLRLGEPGATEPVKALASALNSTILRWLAEANRSPTELERMVQDGGYLDLIRTLRALKRSGLVEQLRGGERRHPYELTDWARRAAAPIGAMIRWESDHVPELASPLTPLDGETLLLLAARSLDPPSGRSGHCAFVVEGLGAVSVVVRAGRVTRCVPGVEHGLANWARGSVAGWRAAILGGTLTALQIHGDVGFTTGLVRALCEALH
jgi:DNA-binding HxlR family transcriptional regulator